MATFNDNRDRLCNAVSIVLSARNSIGVHSDLKSFRSPDTRVIIGYPVNKENNAIF